MDCLHSQSVVISERVVDKQKSLTGRVSLTGRGLFKALL